MLNEYLWTTICMIVASSFVFACFSAWCEWKYVTSIPIIDIDDFLKELQLMKIALTVDGVSREATDEERADIINFIIAEEIEIRLLKYLGDTYFGFTFFWRLCAILGYPFIVFFRILVFAYSSLRNFNS